MPKVQSVPISFFNSRRIWLTVTGCALISLLVTACGSTDSAKPKEVIDNYAAGVYATYEKSVQSAKTMDSAIDAFVAQPTADSLAGAREAWLAARDDYGRTEAFRFYGGPIDNEETGKEGLINAWPLDEQYIDYVQGSPNVGIINNPAKYPTITPELLAQLNEKDGESNVSTGWHAIEFLLWGQDLSVEGPGDRPVTDYTTAPNADRRKTYLSIASDMLIANLNEVTQAWAPNSQNYRAEFVALDDKEALRRIITGIGELSRGELAGERLNVALLERSQEEEQSCFSDNTVADIVADADSIRMVVNGDYGDVSGPGLADLVQASDKKLAKELRSQVDESVLAAENMENPFDKALRAGIPEDDPSRIQIADTIKLLENQTDTFVQAAKVVGTTINVS